MSACCGICAAYKIPCCCENCAPGEHRMIITPTFTKEATHAD